MENEMKEYRKRRVHKVVSRSSTRVMKLSNKQLLVTVPREIAKWKRIEKGTLIKWSDGGINRVIIEVI